MFNKWGALTRHDGERSVRRERAACKGAYWLIRGLSYGQKSALEKRDESDEKCYTSTADEGSMRIRGLRGGILFENELPALQLLFISLPHAFLKFSFQSFCEVYADRDALAKQIPVKVKQASIEITGTAIPAREIN